MNDFIDDLAYFLFFVIDPDIENKIIFFIGIVSIDNLVIVLIISFIDSFLRNIPGQLKSVLGMLIEQIYIEVE